MRRIVTGLTVTLVVAFGQRSALAAAWLEPEYNPRPLSDDVVLPMPCGGAMAFRRVAIPSEGPLSDRLVRLGGAEGERGSLEGSHPAYIAGSFSDGAGSRFFLIGKYEVSRLQSDALAEKCLSPTADSRLPRTDLSWLDAAVLADRYTMWLLRNAGDKLPKEDREPGFVRLPTEVEWEFAARGGIAVSESDFQDRVFPTPGGLGEYVWFAGPQSANGKAQRIGLLKANPLGIHDILGNVDEMVLEPFRLNKLERMHGQAGGFVVRGGNFATAQDEVRTAYRQEIPFYQGQEPRRSSTTGVRLVVSARVVTSRNRLQEIEGAWADLGTNRPPAESPKTGGPSGQPVTDPIAKLGALAAASTDANIKQELAKLQVAFRASFQARDEQRDRAAKARLRLGTFLCQKLKDDGLPIDRMKKVHDACVQARGAQDERCREQQATIDAEEAAAWNNLRYYADTIVTLVDDYDAAVISAQLAVLRGEFAARNDLKVLIPVADRYAQHVAEFRKHRTIRRANWLSECKGL